MKKKYEKDQLIFSLVFLFIFIELLLFRIYLKLDYRTYSMIPVIVITNQYGKTYLNDQELNSLKSSRYLYLDNTRYKYEITSIEKKVLKKKNNWYHEVLIYLNIPKRYKDNDTITISIYAKKEKIYNMLKVCWESDV